MIYHYTPSEFSWTLCSHNVLRLLLHLLDWLNQRLSPFHLYLLNILLDLVMLNLMLLNLLLMINLWLLLNCNLRLLLSMILNRRYLPCIALTLYYSHNLALSIILHCLIIDSRCSLYHFRILHFLSTSLFLVLLFQLIDLMIRILQFILQLSHTFILFSSFIEFILLYLIFLLDSLQFITHLFQLAIQIVILYSLNP